MKNERELKEYFSENSKKYVLNFTYSEFLNDVNNSNVLLNNYLYSKLFLNEEKGKKFVRDLGFHFLSKSILEKDVVNNCEQIKKSENKEDDFEYDIEDDFFQDLSETKIFEEVRKYDVHKHIYDFNNNIQYFQQMRDDNQDKQIVLEKIVQSNQKLVMKIASKYQGLICGSILDIEDLVSFGNHGLLRAIERFDVAKGYKFSTYAFWWIKQKILRGIADYKLTIRLPVHVIEKLNKLRKLDKIYGDMDKDKYILKVLEELKIDEGQFQVLKMYDEVFNNNLSSLNSKVGEENSSELIEVINTINDICIDQDPENKYILKKLSEDIDLILSNKLTEREYKVLNNRFGLKGQIPQTLEAIAKTENVTRERIRQIEKKALTKLKYTFIKKEYKNYLEEFK